MTAKLEVDGYTATFLDGPMNGPGHDRHFCVGEPATRLWFAPLKVGRQGWALVGLGALEPDCAWPGQIRYTLIDTTIGRSGAVAFYRIR